MGKDSKIAWTHHTFNPWWGCQRVSPGCEHCYAEALAKRVGHDVWGPKAEYRRFGDKHWNEPLKWNADALKAGVRHRVFCASMADVFDLRGPVEDRARLWRLIIATPALDWLLLTKRPENMLGMLPWATIRGEEPWRNVWLGTTVESQEAADKRIPLLLAVPAAVRFLSVEPQLGLVDLRRWLEVWGVGSPVQTTGIDWVITGGESGGRARPYNAAWARSIVKQCRAAGVVPFVKQLGAYVVDRNDAGFDGDDEGGWDIDDLEAVEELDTGYQGAPVRVRLKDRAGADPTEWPKDLRVQEFPASPAATPAQQRLL